MSADVDAAREYIWDGIEAESRSMVEEGLDAFEAAVRAEGLDVARMLRLAAQRAVDNWNKVGAMSDDFRALRDALAADELSKSSSSSQAAIRAEGLDVERLYRALETVAQWDPWADQWLRDHAAEYARLAEADR